MTGIRPDREALDSLTWREQMAIHTIEGLVFLLLAPLGAALVGLLLDGLVRHP